MCPAPCPRRWHDHVILKKAYYSSYRVGYMTHGHGCVCSSRLRLVFLFPLVSYRLSRTEGILYYSVITRHEMERNMGHIYHGDITVALHVEEIFGLL